MDRETAYNFLNKQLQRISPQSFNDENSPLFINLLSSYYKGGESKMSYWLWTYAMTLPIDTFNQDAQENNAYGFMMLLLMALAVSFCVSALVFKED